MYKDIVRPILERLDSETWHIKARETLHLLESFPFTLKILEQFTHRRERFTDSRLNVVVGGCLFDNPVVVGAGWDKAGRAVRGLYQLGFAGVEVGTVIAWDQDGNPKPRQFLIGPGVALNRLGFNSPGMNTVDKNLARYENSGIPIGISLGKNREITERDAPFAHAIVAKRLYSHASWFTINVSSPNTPGLRALQDKGPLTEIVQAVNAVMDEMGGRKPLFVKIAPELTPDAINDVITVVVDNGLTGIIASNTTVNPDIKAKYGEKWRGEAGGLSGDDRDFRKMSDEQISHIYREAGDKLEIIGVGGVRDAQAALDKIMVGAKVVQVVTGIVGQGPALPGRINQGLVEWIDRNGIKNINDIVGFSNRNLTTV